MKILLVIDMQKDFVDGALGTAEAQAIVPDVIAKIDGQRKNGGVIIATRDTHPEKYLETQEGRRLPVVHCVKGTDGWQLNEAVRQALPDDAPIIDKPTFGSTELAALIGKYTAEYGEANVSAELIGLCTDICVISNALLLKAYYPEMPIAVDSACCAGVTPETHTAALSAMRMCQIEIR